MTQFHLPRVLTLAAALLLSAVVAPAQETTPSRAHYVWMIAGNAADLWTTRQAFQRGAVEGNGIVTGRPFGVLTASKVSFVTGLTLAMRLLETHGHPRAAKVLGYVDGTIAFGVTAHNGTVNGGGR